MISGNAEDIALQRQFKLQWHYALLKMVLDGVAEGVGEHVQSVEAAFGVPIRGAPTIQTSPSTQPSCLTS
jgi:hypothetical protein